MASSSKSTRKRRIIEVADAASWYCAIVLVVLILLAGSATQSHNNNNNNNHQDQVLNMGRRPCEEIYVVGEGETLHTISDKCGDPYIVEQNPHIHDPDDVFPGLVIKITPFSNPAAL